MVCANPCCALCTVQSMVCTGNLSIVMHSVNPCIVQHNLQIAQNHALCPTYILYIIIYICIKIHKLYKDTNVIPYSRGNKEKISSQIVLEVKLDYVLGTVYCN